MRTSCIPFRILLLTTLLALGLPACKPAGEAPPPSSEARTPAAISQAVARTWRDAPALALVFDAPLEARSSWREWLLVEEAGKQVAGDWVLGEEGRTLYFTAVQPDRTYEVSLKTGLGPQAGRWSLTTRPLQAGATFASSGMVLPLRSSLRLPISAVNVSEVNIDFWRIDPAWLPTFLARYRPGSGMGNWDLEQVSSHATRVYSGRYGLELDPNRRETRLIDIGDKSLSAAGVYFAVMSPIGDYGWRKETTYFAVSDMGLAARRYQDRLEVFVSSLASGEADVGVQLSLLDEKGNRLQVKKSDELGHASFVDPTGARVLLAEQGPHLAALRLDGMALDLSSFDLGERPWQPQRLYLFAGRDLYRPGERIDSQILLRGQDGELLPAMAVDLELRQSDGQLVEQTRLLPDELGSAHYGVRLPDDAALGRWTLVLKSSGGARFEWPFQVEEFLPERLALRLGSGEDKQVMGPAEALTLPLKGDYLYGAPAARTQARAEVTLVRATMPFERWKGFSLGDVLRDKERVTPNPITLDEEGRGSVSLADRLEGLSGKGPLEATYLVSLAEPGGRAVNRRLTQFGWAPGERWPALRLGFDPENSEGGRAQPFEILDLDQTGAPQAGEVTVRLVNEYRDYYWQFSEDEGWKYEFTSQPYVEQEQRLTLDGKGPTPLQLVLQPGWYRLEVENAQGHVSRVRFALGNWSWGGGGEQARPDKIALTLDKPSYRAGDTARVKVVAPRPGKGLLLVEDSEGLRWWQRIDLPKGEGAFSIPVSEQWRRHDLHISAQVVAPDGRQKPGETLRSVGLAPLPLDRSERRWPLTLTAPERAEPEKPLTVTLKAQPGERGKVVLAAVDRGVLTIDDYQPASAFDALFGRLRFGQDLFDNYGAIIPPLEGKLARLRFGGDAPRLKKGGALESRVEILAMWSGELAFDDRGEATVTLNLPRFNGELALMALGWNQAQVGQADGAVKVVAPLVAEIGWPRFAATGDGSRALVQLRNMSGRDQSLTLDWQWQGGIGPTGPAPTRLSLKQGEEQWLTLPFTVTGQSGVASLTLKAEGQGLSLSRSWSLPLRSPWPAEQRRAVAVLAPGKPWQPDAALVAGMLPDNLQGSLSLSGTPPWEPKAQWQALADYPYACLEQTLSRAWPYAFTSAQQRRDWSRPLPAGHKPPDEEALQGALTQRLQRLQLPSGGFGLWNARSSEEPWLTAYAADYLLSRKEAGQTVSDPMLQAALKRLEQYLGDGGLYTGYSEAPEHARLAYQAYSAWVLSRLGRAPLSTLRLMWEQQASQARSGLPLLHLSLALGRMGDSARAGEALTRALATAREEAYLGDYGSPLRDDAAMLALVRAELSGSAPIAERLTLRVMDALAHRNWLSTQEQLALLRLGAAEPGAPWAASLDGRAVSGELTRLLDATTPPRLIENRGGGNLYAALTVSGYPEAAPGPLSAGMKVTRSWFDAAGQRLDPATIKVGDLVVVRLQVEASQEIPDALLVEMLPAGFELENPALGQGVKLEDLTLEGQPAWQWEWDDYVKHQEYRDDRYSAALTLSPGGSRQLIYLMRAVTPGEYAVPLTQVEDMVRPELRARGGEGITRTRIVQAQ